MEEKEEFEEFEEDFEAKPAMYQVWVLGYDKDEAITDFEVLVNESKDPNRMIEYAKKYINEKRYETMTFPEDVAYIEILVETVVDIDDYESNEGTLFTGVVELK